MKISARVLISLFFGLSLPFFTSFIYLGKESKRVQPPPSYSCDETGCLHTDNFYLVDSGEVFCLQQIGTPFLFMGGSNIGNGLPLCIDVLTFKPLHYTLDVFFWFLVSFTVVSAKHFIGSRKTSAH